MTSRNVDLSSEVKHQTTFLAPDGLISSEFAQSPTTFPRIHVTIQQNLFFIIDQHPEMTSPVVDL